MQKEVDNPTKYGEKQFEQFAIKTDYKLKIKIKWKQQIQRQKLAIPL